jgi:hypothetical protein
VSIIHARSASGIAAVWRTVSPLRASSEVAFNLPVVPDRPAFGDITCCRRIWSPSGVRSVHPGSHGIRLMGVAHCERRK